MSTTAILWLCVIAIVISIIISYKKDINMGIIAMAFDFIIGCIFYGLKPAKVFGYWPDSIIFYLLASSLFFSFAQENGTITAFGNKLLYAFRNNVKLLPIAVFLVTAIMTLFGAGIAAVFFVTPIALSIAVTCGIDHMLMSIAVNLGYVSGAYNPWTGTGVVLKGIMETDLGAEVASEIYNLVYPTFLIKSVLFLVIFYVFYMFIYRKIKKNASGKDYRNFDGATIQKPEPFTSIQKKNFILIVCTFIILVLPNVINTWVKIDSKLWKNFVTFCQPQAVCVVFAAIAAIMNLADSKKVIKRLPMSSIMLIAGVCFLMEIAKDAGLLDVISGWFSASSAKWLIAPALVLVAGVLSIFSSATSVVCPLLYPLVPAICASTGLNPVALLTAITVGAGCTALSPFSTAGAQQVALAPDEIKDQMVGRLFSVAVANLVLAILFAVVGLYNLFPYTLG